MHKYRSLFAWQQAHQAAILALKQCDASYHPRSRALFDQLRRATISVEANIVEGYALGTPLQFRRHLRIAMGSAAEEVEYLPKQATDELERLLERAMAALHGLIRKRIPPTP